MIFAGLDCDTIQEGYFRSICEGTSGLPETGENSREQYVKLWKGEIKPVEPDYYLVFRLGDAVAKTIKVLSFGLINQLSGCGCADRQNFLNRVTIWIPMSWWYKRNRTIEPEN